MQDLLLNVEILVGEFDWWKIKFEFEWKSNLDYEAIVKLSDGFNGADMRNVCTEAGMFAIRGERDYVLEEDFSKAVRKVAESKKLESKFDYKAQ